MADIKNFERDARGLLKNIDYVFDDSANIDWRAMIPVKYLYLNSNDPKTKARIEKKYNKSIDSVDIEKDKVADTDLTILLSGLKFLLKLRGFTSVETPINVSTNDYASVTCKINFIGNFETQNKDVLYSDNACANLNNTYNFAQKYLLEIATNRALARCIRSFLNISIVSREELGASDDNEIKSNISADNKFAQILSDLMAKKKIDWPKIADKLKKENLFKEEYTGPDALPKDILFDMIERLKKAKDIV